MFYLRIWKRRPIICHYFHDPYDAGRRGIRRSRMAIHTSNGTWAEISLYHLNHYSGNYLVALALAFIFYTGYSSIWPKLPELWNKRTGIKFCFGKYQKNYRKRMVVRAVSLHCKFLVGNLHNKYKCFWLYNCSNLAYFLFLHFDDHQLQKKIITNSWLTALFRWQNSHKPLILLQILDLWLLFSHPKHLKHKLQGKALFNL